MDTKKKFEAHHSRLYPFVFLGISVALLLLNYLLYSIDRTSPYVVVLLSAISALTVVMFFRYFLRSGIAVEVSDGVVTLYGKSGGSIPLEQISLVSLHTGYGSFDIRISTNDGKIYGGSYLVKDDKNKKKELFTLLNDEGVRLDSNEPG